MTPDRTRHLVEAVLDDQGWSVYRLVLGPGRNGPTGPAIVARRDGMTVVVAVARASEPGRLGPYPRLDRLDGGDCLASVTSAGGVTFHDATGRHSGPSLMGVVVGTPGTPNRHTRPLPRGEACRPL
ncbi:MAG: hypothetical protein AB7G65_19300 [Thermoleophilia bacterium]